MSRAAAMPMSLLGRKTVQKSRPPRVGAPLRPASIPDLTGPRPAPRHVCFVWLGRLLSSLDTDVHGMSDPLRASGGAAAFAHVPLSTPVCRRQRSSLGERLPPRARPPRALSGPGSWTRSAGPEHLANSFPSPCRPGGAGPGPSSQTCKHRRHSERFACGLNVCP